LLGKNALPRSRAPSRAKVIRRFEIIIIIIDRAEDDVGDDVRQWPAALWIERATAGGACREFGIIKRDYMPSFSLRVAALETPLRAGGIDHPF
jgi:hypothetical protein